MNMATTVVPPLAFGIVDLFAGPGGLAEGFSAFRHHNSRPFQVRLSVEMEASAHQTLLLRTFLREFPGGFPDEYYHWLNEGTAEPNWQALYPEEFARANRTALQLELGKQSSSIVINERIADIQREFGSNTILIGGPPCQAYSLVGRARNAGKSGYDAVEDHRHFLYKAYVNVLRNLRPAAFVMENVKGVLSSTVDGRAIFQRILDDLKGEGYRLLALAPRNARDADLLSDPNPADFVVRTEEHGLPQARHRVIVVGVRDDLIGEGTIKLDLDVGKPTAHVKHVLGNMPKLRSGLSAAPDVDVDWRNTVHAAAVKLKKLSFKKDVKEHEQFQRAIEEVIASLHRRTGRPRSSRAMKAVPSSCPIELASWLTDARLTSLTHHETRGHMPSDLGRYLFAASFAEATGRSPKASEFPTYLAPKHANWKTGKFADRFRVQPWDRPSTTITSHISKDGHYFIHPDAMQCRSLTVREAARLQTFPDNYVFKGNRTQQYVQVGNAVPPLLANFIAARLFEILGERLSRQNSREITRRRSGAAGS